MKVFWNNRFIEAKEVPIAYNDRGFQYGDGLFETMVINEGKINLLDYHWQRLKAGINLMEMEPEEWLLDPQFMQSQLTRLVEMNQTHPYARLKLQVTRKPGGLFTPVDNGINILGTAFKLEHQTPYIRPKISAGISKKTRVYPTPYSQFKTCNALPYVMAGMEKNKRKLEDLVLLDHENHVAECCAANIFWLKNNGWFTPSSETGCIDGVMKKNLINFLQKNNYKVQEVKSPIENVLHADLVLACNATGIFPFKQLEDVHYSNKFDSWLTKLESGLVKI